MYFIVNVLDETGKEKFPTVLTTTEEVNEYKKRYNTKYKDRTLVINGELIQIGINSKEVVKRFLLKIKSRS